MRRGNKAPAKPERQEGNMADKNLCFNCFTKDRIRNSICTHCNSDYELASIRYELAEKMSRKIDKYYEELSFMARERLAYADRMGL